MDVRVRLALDAIRSYIKDGEITNVPKDLPAELLDSRAGVFVSLKKHGALRGCIGTIEPCRSSIAEEIIANAISAAARDPRFLPVEADELDELECSVDVLSPPEPCAEDQLDPREYGVIVEAGGRKGLLLPDLEGIDSVREQVEIARRKAGISPGEPVNLYRFRVTRYK